MGMEKLDLALSNQLKVKFLFKFLSEALSIYLDSV